MSRSLRERLVDALRSMRTMVTALCLAAAGWTQAAPAVPDLDAIVSYETRQITAAGVPPSLVARMPATTKSGAGVWHEEKAPDWSHRVLWSEARQVALRVESQRGDGSLRRVVSVEPVAPASTLPWKDLASYTQKEYD